MSKNIFLTGFPGFIGKQLIPKLLQQWPLATVHLVVMAAMRPLAEKTLAEIITAMPEAEGKLTIHVGDISKPELGLDADCYQRLAAEVTDIFHLAAIYHLDTPQEVAEAVNVSGTKNILALALAGKKKPRLHYFSTCYVSGTYQGTFYEDDLDNGQEFKNFYESTKFQAEKQVRQALATVPATIYRPSIVVGDSHSGVTDKFDGPYGLLYLMQKGLHIFRPGKGKVTINIVPIDFIVDATVYISSLDASIGKTFALADPAPLTFSEILRLSAEKYPASQWCIAVPPALFSLLLAIPGVAAWLKLQKNSIAYSNHHVNYDCRNTIAILTNSGIACPPFASYVDAFVDYFKKANHF